MASSPSWPAPLGERLAAALGPVGAPVELGGGYSGGGVWQVRAGDRMLLVKAGPGVADEAAGLRQLRQALGERSNDVAVPEVVVAGDGLLVTEWVEQVPRSAATEEALGAGLATLHCTPTEDRTGGSIEEVWGGGSSWIGACRVDPSPVTDATAFYGRRLLDLATRCGLSEAVEPVVARLDALIPEGGPAVVHGDLWWGNVLWGGDGRAWLIDPSVHAGHPEEDLAMLALFGPLPGRTVDAYRAVRPLADGWHERVELWQLYPLLVHTVLFGSSYRSRVEATARRYA